MKNTRISNPNEARDALKMGSRSPYILWLIWNMWLLFLIPAVMELFQAHPTVLRLIATLVGLALFIGIYMWATWRNVLDLTAPLPMMRSPVSVWLPIVVLTALSLALAPGNGKDWLDLFILTCAYAAGRLPTFQAALVVVALMFFAVAVARLTDPNWLDLVQGVVVIFVVGTVVISLARSVTTGRELRVAREEIARLAVTTERLRIARDLHDLLGHNLSLITLKSELAGRLIRVAPEKAAVEIGDIEHVARTTLQEVREAVAAFRQPALKSELHAAQEILVAAGIAYSYEGDETMIDVLPTAIEAVLSWTVREGVTNVIRHSNAHQCTIRVMRDIHQVNIEVIDDGAGVSSINSSDNEGNGLRGLAERVETLGGRCEASPRVGGGFLLTVSVPLDQQNHNAIKSDSITAALSQQVSAVPPVGTDSSAERNEQG